MLILAAKKKSTDNLLYNFKCEQNIPSRTSSFETGDEIFLLDIFWRNVLELPISKIRQT